MGRGIIRKHYQAALIVLLGLLLIMAGPSCGGTQESGSASDVPGFTGKINTGQQVELVSEQIGTSGGSIVVSKSGDPLDGLQIEVPEGSYQETRTFKVSSAPITEVTFEYINPISPLITIESGGGYSEEIITLQIPVQIPDGHFAMAFYYDDEKGELEGIPLVEETDNSITIATRHFSDIVVSSIPESALGANAEVDTGFFPGVDDWQFTNYGSYIAPRGHCAGQSITALWYYTQMKSAGAYSLYGLYNEGTTDLWEDDARAYRFASTIHRDIDWEGLSVRIEKLSPKAQEDNSMVWKQFVYAMMVTSEPQFVGIHNTTEGGGHAMIVYAISGGALQIADPNYPGSLDREIWYENGEFEPYNSGSDAQAILEGYGKAYDLILYFGASSLVDFGQVSARWSEFEDGTIGNDRFPAYVIQTKNEAGDWVELQDRYSTTNKIIFIDVQSASAQLGYYMTRDSQELSSTQPGGNEFELKPGNNYLGMHVVGNLGNKWKYVDFKYFNVVYESAEATQFSLNCQVDGFGVNPDKSIWDPAPGLNFVPAYEWSVSITTTDPVTKVKATTSHKYQSNSAVFTPPADWSGISAQFSAVITETSTNTWAGGAELVSLSFGRDTAGEATGYSVAFEDSHEALIYNKQYVATIATSVAVPGGLKVDREFYFPETTQEMLAVDAYVR